MGVGQLSESDAVDALRLPFYSSSHPTGSHGWRNQFDLGNPDLVEPPGLHTKAIELAAELGQNTAYDTHYLALAEMLDCEVWTADEHFFRSSAVDFPRVRWIGQL